MRFPHLRVQLFNISECLAGGEISMSKADKLQNEMDMIYRLGHILDASPNEIYMFDAQTLRFLLVNTGSQRNLGYAMDELRNMSPLDLKPEFTREMFESLIAPLRSGEIENLIFETTHKRKNGTFYPVEARLHLSTRETVPVFVAIVQDITSHKAMENALRDSELQTRLLLENLESAIVVHAADGSITYMNAAAQRFFGFDARQMQGKNMPDFLPRILREDGSEMPLEELPENRVLRTGKGFYNYVVGAKFQETDNPRWALINAYPDLDSNGSINRVVVSFVEITRRKAAEEALARSEKRFVAMANNVPGMVFQYLLRNSGRFTYVSEGSVALCGLSPKALLEDSGLFENIFSKTEKQRFFDAMHQSAKDLSVWNWEGKFLHLGREKWVNLRATPRDIGEGALIWDGVIIDITEGKEMAQNLAKSRELLREFTAHRDAVMEEEQKRIARDIHDELGQSLTALKIDLDSLREHTYDQGGDAKVQRMQDILDKTVDSVRRITGRLRPGMLDDLGLAAAIEWQVEKFAVLTGIPCELIMNRDDFELDERMSISIYRIIQEALTNVSRHAFASRVQVSLLQQDGEIVLEVRDDGRGFQAAEKQRSYGLLGIKERVHILGGKVKIDSKAGSGTLLRVNIPLGDKS